MAMYSRGLGSSIGDELIANQPLYITGNVWYVSNAVPENNYHDGLDRRAPFFRLADAIEAASGGDTIVLMDGHDEIVPQTQTIDKRLTLVGEGRVDGMPSPKLTPGHESGALLSCEETVHLRNIRVMPREEASATASIYLDAAECTLENVWLEGDEDSTGAVLQGTASATSLRIVDCTIVAVEPLKTQLTFHRRPQIGFLYAGAGDLWIDGLVLDGGAYGWEQAAMEGIEAITNIYAKRVSLLRRSVMKLKEGTLGWVMPTSASGGGRVVWPEGGSSGALVNPAVP